jgi:hypothetical protein
LKRTPFEDIVESFQEFWIQRECNRWWNSGKQKEICREFLDPHGWDFDEFMKEFFK